MKHSYFKRLLALGMVLSMILGAGPVLAAEDDSGVSFTQISGEGITADLMGVHTSVVEETEKAMYAQDQQVRVTIVLEQEPALSVMARQEAPGSSYRQSLQHRQELLADTISQQVLDGETLDVVWNLTLAENAISANVAYGKIDEIKALDGVRAVYLETRYEPMKAEVSNIIAQETTGAARVKNQSGYTGAGTRIAVVDTGIDTDHQSMDDGAYVYALSRLAEQKGMELQEYVDTLHLLDQEEIASVLDQLNISKRYEGLKAEDLYGNSKRPFQFNYVDNGFDVTHDNDTQGSHGSHVAGISTANTYIPAEPQFYDFDGDGAVTEADAQALLDHVLTGKEIRQAEHADVSGNGVAGTYDVHLLLDMIESGKFYADGAKTVYVTGVAPEAQLLTMKVFGAKGGAYSSDYMAAVEDAVVLGCETVNLSLGAPYAGFVGAHEEKPEDSAYVNGIMEGLKDSGIVMCVASGNSGNWADFDHAYGAMYTDEAGTAMTAEPGTFTNALSVASSDNVGMVLSHRTYFGTDLEASLMETPNAAGTVWNDLDEKGEGTTYEVVFLGDPSRLFAGDSQTDERIYGGLESDFASCDYSGKVVMIARGNGVLFAKKHELAAQAGASAVILYNNVPGIYGASLEGSTASIPCVTMSLEDAAAIFKLTRNNEDQAFATTVTVQDGTYVTGGDHEHPAMSDFSSWGTTGALTIKPEITAPGGSIYSINGVEPGGKGYELMSGTSMATPHISGLNALAMQYLKEQKVLDKAREVSGLKDLSLRNLAQSLLMSTAKPLMEQESGVEYSVRNQGSGLADIDNLVHSEAFVLVDGQPDGKVKAELGDGKEGWSYSFTVYNLTDAVLRYELDPSMLTTGTKAAEPGINLSTSAMTRLDADLTYRGQGVEENVVTVPAGGAAKVTVEIKIPEATRQHMLSLGYSNGFYVEGYLYLRPLADQEGKLPSTHSIAMLGWYGNWTDPSMFDTGSFLETAYGTARRPSHIDTPVKNVLTWCPKGDDRGRYYTGNIYGSYDQRGLVGDRHYYPERNAISSNPASKWQLYAMFPTMIRNAADVEVRITDANTGKVYHVDDYEHMDDMVLGSFYYPAMGQWVDTTSDYGMGFNWDLTDPDTGKPVEEGTVFDFTFLAAPDYYGNPDGSTRWEELGHGARMSFRFTVDNTAPVLTGSQPLTLSEDRKTLYYSAQDNNYIAAVALLDGSGKAALTFDYPDMEPQQKGQAIRGGLDLTEFYKHCGNKAVVAVCDYAGNESFYAVNLGGEGTPYGQFLAYQYDFQFQTKSWISFNEGVSRNETKLFDSEREFVAAEYVNGYVFAQTDNGKLYAYRYEDMLNNTMELEGTYITTLENIYQDFAFNYRDGKLYGMHMVTEGEYPSAEIFSITLADTHPEEPPYEEQWAASRGGVNALGMAIDDAGTIYVVATAEDEQTGKTGTACLWKSELQENYGSLSYAPWEMVGDTGLAMDYLQAMTWDHNTESLYWSRFVPVNSYLTESTLEKVDPETAQCTRVGELSIETACLMAPLTPETAQKEQHRNVPVFDRTTVGTPALRTKTVTMNVGAVQTLDYDLRPWYTGHKAVQWSSDNETVATVDQQGNVTAHAVGSANITVTNLADQTKLDTAAIEVAALDLELEGVFSTQTAGIGQVGEVRQYAYTMEQGTPQFTPGNKITASEEQNFGLNMAASCYGRGSLWACESGNLGMLYEMNPETGEVIDVLQPIDGDMLFGMTYSEKTDAFSAIMNYYLYVDLPFTHEAEKDIQESYDPERHEFMYHKFDLSPYLMASDQNFVTGETGNGSITDVVFCGITAMPGGTYMENTYKDFLGNWDYGNVVSYTPDLTLALLDNVGRIWYIDEVTGMSKETIDGSETYVRSQGEDTISAGRNGVFAQEYTHEGEESTYSVFVIREIVETPLLDMYQAGVMPRYTYHFSDMEYAGTTNQGDPMFVMSLYDYWNEGRTNELYLYIPGHETGEMDPETGTLLRTADRLLDLGDTGLGNIIATIDKATITGGLADLPAPRQESSNSITVGWFPG